MACVACIFACPLKGGVERLIFVYKQTNTKKEVQCTFTCCLSQICVVAEQDHMQGIKCMLLLIVLLQKPPQTKKASLSLQL